MNARVEYELRPVRHIAVQCESCKNWFDGREIADHDIHDEIDMEFATFLCPVCGNEFGYHSRSGSHDVIEVKDCASADEVYSGCLRKKEIWE